MYAFFTTGTLLSKLSQNEMPLILSSKSYISLNKLEELSNFFLNNLEDEEYKVVTNQKLLHNYFEKLLSHIYKLNKPLEKQKALTFAKTLSKGANIYRRVATKKSLNLAIKYHKKSIALKKQFLNFNNLELGYNFLDLGAAYNELKGKKNNIQAIKYYKQALKIFAHQKSEIYIATTFHQIANAYRDLDIKHTKLAIDYINKALKIINYLPKLDFNKKQKAKFLYNQGVNYHLIKQYKKAIIYLNKAKLIFKENNDQVRLAITLSYLGNVYRFVDNKLAIYYLNNALSIQKTIFKNGHAEIEKTLGYLKLSKKNNQLII